jgi:hypothetical protein
MEQASLAVENANCLRAVANALTVDPGLIEFLKSLAPQWGSSTGKTRSYSGLGKSRQPGLGCILRVDSRAAILLNEALYSPQGPSRTASHLADALRHPITDETGTRCVIQIENMPPIEISIDQYSDADGNPVAPDSAAFHHRVVSIVPG